jgi:hypothetical protein
LVNLEQKVGKKSKDRDTHWMEGCVGSELVWTWRQRQKS